LTYPEWLKAGKKNSIDYAKEIMEDILAKHKVDPPLTPREEDEVESILIEARDYYKKKELISDSEWEEYREILKKEGRPY
jgi:dTDP-glucose pyrophosphorylase